MKKVYFRDFRSLPNELDIQLFLFLSKLSISSKNLINEQKRKYFYELKNTSSFLSNSECDLLALINLLYIIHKATNDVNFFSDLNKETQRLVEIIKNDKTKKRKKRKKEKEEFLINKSSEINNMIANGFSSRDIRKKYNSNISHSHICEIVKAYPEIFHQFEKKKS